MLILGWLGKMLAPSPLLCPEVCVKARLRLIRTTMVNSLALVNAATSNHDLRSLFDGPILTIISEVVCISMISLTVSSLIKPQFFKMSELNQWEWSFQILLSPVDYSGGKLLEKFVPPSRWWTCTCFCMIRPIWIGVGRLQSNFCMTRPVWRRVSGLQLCFSMTRPI